MGTFTEHSAEEQSISYRFPKEERLRSKKLIEQLFREGSSFNSYPLRFVALHVPGPAELPVQVLVSVSKRNFKKAVDRNRLKRQMREAYRLHKHVLLKPQKEEGTWYIGILYIGKEKNPFNLISKKLNSGLERLLTK
ncbi:ribonuclease P protein component [Rufibacter latericius]|uniref:Ribonuclease P protein component n=1 Tax=Rufibacter latericius TaxID=2487040 RepID=A0A3M9MCR0_9BACT|nr:ribonuclease P protein component [Rufibacter latericius]RNI23349.1 ribonuclease P protein component [Rufibacter latericius]